MTEARLMTILFADVAGSADMYSRMGDMTAHRQIVQLQQGLSVIVDRHGGSVVEVIGDEIMCSFAHADEAFTAALEIQAYTEHKARSGLNVRIGFHCGPTSEHDGHPFGDTVNVAARVVSMAKAGQIMLTAQAHQHLGTANRSSSGYFNKVRIKGKREVFTIYQAIAEEEERTILTDSEPRQVRERRQPVSRVQLCYGNSVSTIEDGEEILLGRGDQCQLRIDSEFASRVHATIACRSGKMVLNDRSTNGTFIRTKGGNRTTDGAELFLHQDQWSSTCCGEISLGASFGVKGTGRVQFSCEQD